MDFKEFTSQTGEAVGLAADQPDAGMLVINPSRITDYEQAKPMLCVEVVGTARNADMLEKVPHTDIEDMSMVYRVQLGHDDRSAATVLITNEMLERYGVSKDQLHLDAMESTQQVRPATIQTMKAVMADMMGIPVEQMPDDPVPPMYVVTNEQRLQGAAAMFYPGLMEAAARELKGDFFVLPSSVHEVLLLPDDGTMSSAELNAMVKSVNRAEVRESEQLSDTVYHYDAAARAFERGDAYEARRDEKLNVKESRSSVLRDLQDKKQDMDLKPRAAAHRAKTDPEL